MLFRFPLLSERPMHGDEAVNAVKIGELIEGSGYRYDPHEYHGPTLNYFSLFFSWVYGVGSFSGLSEQTLRLLPVVVGCLLLLLVFSLRGALGSSAILFSAFFIAVSPSMIFYSRYFIHESILVLFTSTLIIGGYFYLKSPKKRWALLIGFSLGLMHATKETFVIALASIILSILLLFFQLNKKERQGLFKRIRVQHLFLMLVSAALVSILFFTSFFNNPKGIIDSFSTYIIYADRAGNSVHEHPWYFYFQLLFFYKFSDGPYFSEWIVLFLSVVGVFVSLRGRWNFGDPIFVRFIVFFTVAMITVYSFLPYKTPWCLLGFYYGMLLLAGVGAVQLVYSINKVVRFVSIGAIILGIAHLGQQAYGVNYKYFDSRNPHIYGHTSSDIIKVVDKVKSMAAIDSDSVVTTRIQVYCPENDYWPLPWYLRDNQVEYGSSVSEETQPAPIIIIQPSMEDDLMRKLYELPSPGQRELYMHLFYNIDNGTVDVMELRPSVEIVGFVSRSLFEKYLQSNANDLEADP